MMKLIGGLLMTVDNAVRRMHIVSSTLNARFCVAVRYFSVSGAYFKTLNACLCFLLY